jgi:hypothetical protein
MKCGFSRQLSELNFLKDFLTRHELFNHPPDSPPGYSAVGPWEISSRGDVAGGGVQGFCGAFRSLQNVYKQRFMVVWWKSENFSVQISTGRFFCPVEIGKKFCCNFHLKPNPVFEIYNEASG